MTEWTAGTNLAIALAALAVHPCICARLAMAIITGNRPVVHIDSLPSNLELRIDVERIERRVEQRLEPGRRETLQPREQGRSLGLELRWGAAGLTASAGVAPLRPPVSGRASVTWRK